MGSIYIGGGQRNEVYANKYNKCTHSAVHIDSRGMSWQKADCSPVSKSKITRNDQQQQYQLQGGLFEQQLKSVDYQNPPWSTHFPELVNILKDYPCTPVYNEVMNITYCGENFIDISGDQYIGGVVGYCDQQQKVYVLRDMLKSVGLKYIIHNCVDIII